MFKSFFFKGNIPLFKYIHKLLKWMPLSALLLLTHTYSYRDFGKVGWWILVFILFLRPVSNIMPKLGILKTILAVRKELGILSGVYILTHGIGFFLAKKLPLPASFINPKFWSLNGLIGWGMIAFFLTIIILLSSNNWALKKMKKWWKPVQRLSYPVFFLTAIHLSFTNFLSKTVLITLSIILIILLWLAHKKTVLWK